MKKSKITILNTLIFLVALIGFAFGMGQKDTKKESEEIKIGVILSLTGPGAPYGQAEKEGMEQAVDEINKNGGVNGGKISLVIEDDKTEPAAGVSAINKLIQVDKTKVVLGALASSVTLAIAPIAEKNRVILITPGSSNPAISKAGDYIFRFYPSDDYQGKILAEWASKNNLKKVVILYINNDFGVGLKNKFKQEFESKNGNVVAEEAYEQGEKDFRTHLTKIKNVETDGIFIIAAGQENANILIQSKEIGLNKKIFAPDAFKDEDNIKIAGNAAEGVICSAPSFSLSEKREVVINFTKKYNEKYQKNPNVFAAYGYDVVFLLSNLIKNNGYDIDKIKAGLYKTKSLGVIGQISFDENGDLVPSMDFYIVRNGKFDLLKEIK